MDTLHFYLAQFYSFHNICPKAGQTPEVLNLSPKQQGSYGVQPQVVDSVTTVQVKGTGTLSAWTPLLGDFEEHG